MDSVTQAALGATVAYAVSGNRIGRRALVTGALIGTLPDLDVLVPYKDAVDNFTYHRSWSHSIFVLTLVTPAIAWLTAAVFRTRGVAQRVDRNLLLMVWLVFVTHVLLDSFTVYGTQVFWPLSHYPVGWGSIFIIDPVFTLPLLVAIFIVFRSSKAGATNSLANKLSDPLEQPDRTALAARRSRPVLWALGFSVAYLLLTVVIQQTVVAKARQSLNSMSFDTQVLSVLPSPGSLLWRVVARSDDEYLEGFYSVFDTFEPNSRSIGFSSYASGDELLLPINSYPPVQRLQWFTKGLYATQVVDDKLVMSDLRMGIEAQYVFRFQMGTVASGSNGVSAEERTMDVEPLQPTVLQRFQPDIPRVKQLLWRVVKQPAQPL